MVSEQHASRHMRSLCLAGRIILENGGETYRAEDTVAHMAHSLGLSEIDVFGVPSGLFLSFTDEAGERHTSVTRVFLRGTHLARVDAVNQISRKLADGTLAPSELLSALQQAERLGQHPSPWLAPLAAAFSAAGFAAMFGGGWVDMLMGGFCAALTQLVPRLLRRWDDSSFLSTAVSGMLCALIPLVFCYLTGMGRTEAMVASAIMPLVPGLSMTNAVQDILRGDMVSGVAHAARALMIAALVAGGALAGTHLYAMMVPGAQAATFTASLAEGLPLLTGCLLAIGASFAAGVGFGLLLNAPHKSLLCGGLIGSAGYLSYWLLLRFGVSEVAAMFLGTLVAACGGQLAARHLKMIATVYVTIAMLPLIPGLGLYRAMSTLALGASGEGMMIVTQTMTLILMIALGLAIGSSIFGVRRRSARR